MIVQGCSMSLFQASQRRATIWSQDGKILFQSQLSRMNCQAFSTGFSSGDLAVEGAGWYFSAPRVSWWWASRPGRE